MNLRVRNDRRIDQAEVYLCLEIGEFDDDLKWPFRGQVKVQVKHKNGPTGKPKAENMHTGVCRCEKWFFSDSYSENSLFRTRSHIS